MQINEVIKIIMGSEIIIKYNLVDIIDTIPSGKYRYAFSKLED